MIISTDTEKVAEKYSILIHILNLLLEIKIERMLYTFPFPLPQFSTEEPDFNCINGVP